MTFQNVSVHVYACSKGRVPYVLFRETQNIQIVACDICEKDLEGIVQWRKRRNKRNKKQRRQINVYHRDSLHLEDNHLYLL